MEPIRILIADDHPLFRDGLRVLLESVPDMQVIGEATTGNEVLEEAHALQPDLILMDIRMPGINGIEATRRILQTSPHIRVLILTMFQDEASVFTAMRAGARGYVLKDADKEDILRALFAVGRGEAIFSPEVATRIVDFFAASPPAAPRQAFPSLTEREREILYLAAKGEPNPAITTS